MYKKPSADIWTGRTDTEDGNAGLRIHQVIQLGDITNIFPANEKKYAFIGFRSDEGVRRNRGRIGARDAPDLIRQACANLPFLYDKHQEIFDFGNINCYGEALEEAREVQISSISHLLQQNYFPVVLGGGHEVALGNFLALAEHYSDIGIVNIDAHFDLRIPSPKSSSGTPFYQIAEYCKAHKQAFNYLCLGIQEVGNTFALFDRADELKVKYLIADEIHHDISSSIETLKNFLNAHKIIYLTLDLDVLDGAFAPGVSAPATNGLTPHQVKMFIKTVIESKKMVLFDIAEYNPKYDQDGRTSKLAAQFINQILEGEI